jgi:competence protein ComGC
MKTKGFTLIETITSIFIITIGIVSVFSTVTKYSQMTQRERENFTASYLAQEGVEIVRNMRDTNWVEEAASWKDGLTACSSGCEADYEDTSLSGYYLGLDFYIDHDTGLYKYIASPEAEDVKTIYKREIFITEVGDDELDVEVYVYWPGSEMVVKENIYNWK